MTCIDAVFNAHSGKTGGHPQRNSVSVIVESCSQRASNRQDMSEKHPANVVHRSSEGDDCKV